MIFIITCLFTSIASVSYLNSNEDIIVPVKDLQRVENNLGIVIKKIISCKYEKNL
ncbi:hypothetical protein [Paraclostridium sordellii]